MRVNIAELVDVLSSSSLRDSSQSTRMRAFAAKVSGYYFVIIIMTNNNH